MASTAILAIKIISDAAGAAAGFNQASSAAGGMQQGLGQAAQASAAVVAGMVAIGAASVKAASDAQQAAGAVESVFGAASAEVMKYADAAADSVHLSEASYNQLAATLGAQLKNLGISQQELAGSTNDLIVLGGDLAATFGGPTSDAVAALSSLMRGERDPIEKYGVSIKQADINARLASQGMSKLEGEAKKQAETQATLALLYEQTADATGQLARESDTAAGQAERMKAKFSDAKAALGEALLPALTKLADVLADVFGWIEDNHTAFVVIAAVVGTLATAIIAANVALGIYTTVSGLIAAANTIQAISWMAVATGVWAATWPILLVIAIIVAVVAVIWLVINNLDTLQAVWDAIWKACETAVMWVWDGLKSVGDWIAGVFNDIVTTVGDVFQKAFDIAKRVVEALLAPINAIIGAIQSLIGWISNIKWPSPPGWLSKISPFAIVPGVDGGVPGGGAMAYGAAPRVPNRVTNVNIVVNGALDPIAVGRQIGRTLQTADRAIGVSNAVVLSPDRRYF